MKQSDYIEIPIYDQLMQALYKAQEKSAIKLNFNPKLKIYMTVCAYHQLLSQIPSIDCQTSDDWATFRRFPVYQVVSDNDHPPFVIYEATK